MSRENPILKAILKLHMEVYSACAVSAGQIEITLPAPAFDGLQYDLLDRTHQITHSVSEHPDMLIYGVLVRRGEEKK